MHCSSQLSFTGWPLDESCADLSGALFLSAPWRRGASSDLENAEKSRKKIPKNFFRGGYGYSTAAPHDEDDEVGRSQGADKSQRPNMLDSILPTSTLTMPSTQLQKREYARELAAHTLRQWNEKHGYSQALNAHRHNTKQPGADQELPVTSVRPSSAGSTPFHQPGM